jgi:hypothetical protein
MATVSTAKRSIEVTLIRPGADSQTLTLAEGATLGDVLREAGAAIRNHGLLIDGRPVEDVLVMKTGMTITIGADGAPVPPNGSWQATVGAFSHPDFWREVVAEGRAIREADRESARNQAEQDDR